jgi:sugar transferase (PEP-CTERM/EpsH1 system associated)
MKLCFVVPRFPYPPTRGDQVRTYHQIRFLSARHRITLVAACDRTPEKEARAEMARWCERIETVPIGGLRALLPLAAGVLATTLPLQVLYHLSSALNATLARVLAAQPHDLVHASLLRTAPYVWNVRPPVVLDLVDALSRSIAARLPHLGRPLRAIYAFERGRIERYEREACAHFRRSIVSAQADADALGGDNVAVIRNAVDLERFPYVAQERESDLFVMTGNMGYHPNVDGAAWFATNVWPRIRQAVPAARLQLVGARPAAAVRALERIPGIAVVADVPDVHEYLRRAAVAICPIRCGSGIQNKVLEAMASGTPMLSTPHGNEGVGALPDREILLAQEPQAFAQAAISLLADAPLRERLARAARARIEEDFTWERHARRLEEVYEKARETAV